MLDQNTDRMWYVIGAVIVGAAIIFIANGTLPDIFASVSKSFEGASEDAQLLVADIQIGWQSLGPDHIIPYYSKILEYDEETETFLIEIDPEKPLSPVDSGVRIKRGAIRVPYNHKHTIKYEVKIPFDSYTRQDVNTEVLDGDHWAKRGTIDNDEWSSRRFNGKTAQLGVDYHEGLAPVMNQDVPGNVWHNMSYSYTNTDPNNINQLDIIDTSSFGIRVPKGQKEPFTIEIRQVRNIVEPLEE